MAQVPYDGGVPSVTPSVQQPDNYQRIQTSPNEFGGLVAQGLQQLGEGASKAGLFFGQAAADTASNNYQDTVTKLLHGDPNKMVVGPGGDMVPDTGYLGLKGQAAMDARPAVSNAMDKALADVRSQLQTPEQQLQFDNFSRRYRSIAQSQVGEHVDQQSLQWYSEVNKSTEAVALSNIALTPDDPAAVKLNTDQIINAHIKQAELSGAQKGDQVWTAALQTGRQAALAAQVTSIGVKDPARALELLDQNKAAAGTQYDNLYGALRSRANLQQGQAIGAAAIKDATEGAATSAALSGGPHGAATGDAVGLIKGFEGFRTSAYWDVNHYRAGYGSDTATLADGTVVSVTPGTQVSREDADRDLARRAVQFQHTVQGQIGEAAWNSLSPNAQASLTSVAYNYGSLPKGIASAAQTGDPETIAKAILSHAGDNGGINAKRRTAEANNVLGHAVAGPAVAAVNSEAGAPAANPEVAAAPSSEVAFANSVPSGNSATATDATPPGVSVAGATTAASTPASPAAPPPGGPMSLKSDAYQRIMSDPNMDPEVRQHALTYVNQQLQAQQIAADEDTKAKKAANDKAADVYVKKMLSGDNAGLLPSIIADPSLNFETRHALGEAAMKQSGNDAQAATQQYGPGFWNAFKQVSALPGDPTRINDMTELLQRAGPNGDLTLAGVDKLGSVMKANQKSVEDQAVNTSRASLISYAKSKLSFEQDTGLVKLRDPKGEAIFSGQFVPKFMAAYDTWVKDGKNPWDFLTQDNVNKMIAGMRPAAQMAQDRMSALGELTGEPAPLGAPAESVKAPPAPENTNPQAWTQAVTQAPMKADGSSYPIDLWSQALSILSKDPSPSTIAAFQKKFGPAGYDANEILKGFQTPAGQTAPKLNILSEEERNNAKIRNASVGHVR